MQRPNRSTGLFINLHCVPMTRHDTSPCYRAAAASTVLTAYNTFQTSSESQPLTFPIRHTSPKPPYSRTSSHFPTPATFQSDLLSVEIEANPSELRLFSPCSAAIRTLFFSLDMHSWKTRRALGKRYGNGKLNLGAFTWGSNWFTWGLDCGNNIIPLWQVTSGCRSL